MALTPFRRGLGLDPFSWDPFFSSPFPSLLSGEASMYSLFHPDLSRDTFSTANSHSRLDWKETPDAHIFKADLPGLKKEELKVEVEDGRVLSIRGERSKEKREETDTWHRVERSQGSFMRKLRLPENIKEDEMSAAMENGVLTITIPKSGQPNKRNVRTIQIA